MASIRKLGKTYYALFRDAKGKQITRTTKTSDAKDARRIADAMEFAARGSTADAVATSVEQLRNLASLRYVPRVTDVLDSWITSKTLTIAASTATKYRHTAELLRATFGARDIASITSRELEAIRQTLATKHSPSTCNNYIKIIRSFFAYALKQNYLSTSPATALDYVKKTSIETSQKRPFSRAEVAALLDALTPEKWTLNLSVPLDEWRGMVLCGLYTAQRLGDIARLKRANLDMRRHTLSLRTQKTNKQLTIPLAPPLIEFFRDHLPTLTSEEIFPSAAHTANLANHVATLSRQFSLILTLAELTPKRQARRTREAGDQLRQSKPLSYHSLRHTATTWLYEAGVPRAVVMELVGHDSAAMSQHYTHIGLEALQNAVSTLPTL